MLPSSRALPVPVLRAARTPLPEGPKMAPASSLLRDGQTPPPRRLLGTTTPRQPAASELHLPACPARQGRRASVLPHYISQQAAGPTANLRAPCWSVRGGGLASVGVSGPPRGSGAGEAAAVTFPFGPPPPPALPLPERGPENGSARRSVQAGPPGRAGERPVGWGRC